MPSLAPACILAALFAAGCRAGDVEVVSPRPGGSTGHVQVRLDEVVDAGDVLVDGEVVAVLERPTSAVVLHLPHGARDILVVGVDGEAQGALVEVGPRLVTARAGPREPAFDVSVIRPDHLSPPPEGPPRPCSRLGVVAHLRIGAGVRLCQAIGPYVSVEAIAGTLFIYGGAEIGATVHLGPRDWIPYLALRRGVFATLRGAGSYVAPAIGWRFGAHFIEVGPAFLRFDPATGEPRDAPSATFIFGWD